MHAQSCLTLCNSMHCSPLGSSVLAISQARIGLPFSPPGVLSNWGIELISPVFCIVRQILYHCTTWKAPFHYQIEIKFKGNNLWHLELMKLFGFMFNSFIVEYSISIEEYIEHKHIFKSIYYLFIWIIGLICCSWGLQLWNVGSSSLTRDWTRDPCIGHAES